MRNGGVVVGGKPWGRARQDEGYVRKHWQVVYAPPGWEAFEGRLFGMLDLRKGVQVTEGRWPVGMRWRNTRTGEVLEVMQMGQRYGLKQVEGEGRGRVWARGRAGLTSVERLAAVRRAYAALSDEERAEVDVWVRETERAMKAAGVRKFGRGAALELVAALAMWALEWEAAQQVEQAVRMDGLVVEG